MLPKTNYTSGILAVLNLTLANTGKSFKAKLQDFGRKALNAADNVLLGVFSSLVSNVDLTLADIGAVKKDGTLIIWGRDVDRFYNPDIEKLILYEGSEKGTKE